MSTYLGIDIGTSTLKVAVLRGSSRKLQIAAFLKMPIDKAAAAGEITDPALSPPSPERDAIRALVSTALSGKPQAHDGSAVGIPGDKGVTRRLNFPKSIERQLGEVLPFELDAGLPFEVEDAVFDYRTLGAARHSTDDKAELAVLVALARQSTVKDRIDLVRSAIESEPEVVTIGALPIANLVPYMPSLATEEPVIVVDVGTRSSDVLILKGGEPAFTRTLSLGTEGLPASAGRLARELRVTIAAYRSAGGPPPGRVMLAGGGAFVSGSVAFLAGELELPVEPFPIPQIDLSLLPPESVAELPLFAKALGLALAPAAGKMAMSMNLRKGGLAYERGFGWLKERAPLLAGLGTALLVSFVFSAITQFYGIRKDRELYEGALAEVTKEVLGEETESAQRAQELLATHTSSADDDPLPRADAFDVMVKISDAVPSTMVHDIEELDLQKGHVTIHGVVGTIPDAQAIATKLKETACFSDVKITRTNQVVGGDRQKYVLEFDIKCPDDQKNKKKPGETSTSASAAPQASGGK